MSILNDIYTLANGVEIPKLGLGEHCAFLVYSGK